MVIQYWNKGKSMQQELVQINLVRNHKKLYLLYKLLGLKGNKPTRACEYLKDTSGIKWKFNHAPALIPKGKMIKVQNRFIQWMKE